MYVYKSFLNTSISLDTPCPSKQVYWFSFHVKVADSPTQNPRVFRSTFICRDSSDIPKHCIHWSINRCTHSRLDFDSRSLEFLREYFSFGQERAHLLRWNDIQFKKKFFRFIYLLFTLWVQREVPSSTVWISATLIWNITIQNHPEDSVLQERPCSNKSFQDFRHLWKKNKELKIKFALNSALQCFYKELRYRAWGWFCLLFVCKPALWILQTRVQLLVLLRHFWESLQTSVKFNSLSVKCG